MPSHKKGKNSMSPQTKRGTKRTIRGVSGRVPVGRNNTKKIHSVRAFAARTNMNNLANAFSGMYINKRRKPKATKGKKKITGTLRRAKQKTDRAARAAKRSHIKSVTPARRTARTRRGRRTNAFRMNNMLSALNEI